MSNLPVTVIIPAKNEEINLPKCLDNLTEFTEVIIIDSNSTDKTPEIANEYGRTIINFTWNGQFPKKRNWTLRNVPINNPWVLFLDADEYISPEFVKELKIILSDTTHNAFWLTYKNYFFGKYLKYGDVFRKLALFKFGSAEYEKIDEDSWSHLDMEVHEHPVLTGSSGAIRCDIKHEDYKGMKAYISKHNEYSEWEAHRYFQIKKNWRDLTSRQKFKYTLLNTWFLGPIYFVYCYFLKCGFLDGKAGFIFAILKLQYFWQIKIKIDEKNNSTS